MAKKTVLSRKEKVMKTAMEMVAEGGFHGAPMAALAERSGVAIGTIYHHFASKEDLIVALYVKAKLAMYEAADAAVEGKGNYKDKMNRLWMALYQHFVSRPVEFSFIEQYNLSPFVADTDALKGAGSGVSTMLKAGIKEGKLVKTDAALLHDFIYGTVSTAARAHLAKGTRKLGPKDLEVMSNMCWSAVKS
jgi:AcrR family transcriptional regulator